MEVKGAANALNLKHEPEVIMQENAANVNNPQECSCGKWYQTAAGVSMCQSNKHGSGKDKWNDTYEFNQSLVTEIKVNCTECGIPLAYIMTKDKSGDLRLDVPPHVCQIDAPEETGVAA